MNKILAFLLLALVGPSAQAGVTCSVPFNLQNGTTADATQVMANYNAIIACLGNAATAGANNDITSLTALSTPITPAQGGTNTWTGGTSTGSANAQVVTPVTPSAGFSLAVGKKVIFRAGFSSTAATQINVAGTGLVNLYRITNVGAVATVGGEIVTGQMVEIVYDGAQYQISNPHNNAPIGSTVEFRGSIPPGFLLENGACVSRTGSTAALFAVIGTTYGGACSGSEFALPDSRGRYNAGYDADGEALTVAGSGCNGAVLGTRCGSQNFTLLRANLMNIQLGTAMFTNNVTVTDTRNLRVPSQITGSIGGADSLLQANATNNNINVVFTTGSIGGALASDGSHPAGSGVTDSLSGGVAQTPTIALPPLMVTYRAIKY